MILAVCTDKGAPGCTTVATALAVVWPGPRVLVEADPSGGDLVFRLRDPGGGQLASEPTVLSLAADAREVLATGSLAAYAQPTSLGVPVLLGPMSAEGFEPMARLWPTVAAEAHRWPGTVIADLGRLQARHPAASVAAAATAVLLVVRADTGEDLCHARDRAAVLADRLGQGPHGASPLAVLVVCPAKHARRATADMAQLLASQPGTATIPVAGFVADDVRGVQELRSGQLSRRLLGSELIRSAQQVVSTLLGWWPQFTPTTPLSADPPTTTQMRPSTGTPGDEDSARDRAATVPVPGVPGHSTSAPGGRA